MKSTHNFSAHDTHQKAPWLRYGLLSLLVTLVYFGGNEVAYAQQSPMGNVICGVVGIIYGNLGRGLAILSVIVVGIGATLGKVSWGLAITTAIGIAVVFGAVPLTAYLISGNAGLHMCYGAGGVW